MRKRKSSLSHAKSYQKMGAFWDVHDLSEYWDNTKFTPTEVAVFGSRVTGTARPDSDIAGGIVEADLIELSLKESYNKSKYA